MSTSVAELQSWHENLARNLALALEMYPEASVLDGRYLQVDADFNATDIAFYNGGVYVCTWVGDPRDGGVCVVRNTYHAPKPRSVLFRLTESNLAAVLKVVRDMS